MGYLPHRSLENPSGDIYINMDVDELSFHIDLYDIMRTKIEGYDYILNSKIKEECEVINKELYLKLIESSPISDNLKIGIDQFISNYVKYERLLNLTLYSRKLKKKWVLINIGKLTLWFSVGYFVPSV